MDKPGFMIYSGDWAAALESFSDKEIGAVFRALLLYHNEGQPTEFKDRALTLMFRQAAAAYDRDSARYAEICEKRRKNIQKRWSDTNEYKSIQENTTDTNSNTNSSSNSNPNSSSNDNSIRLEEAADAPQRKRFVKPSIEDIQDYCIETGRTIDAQRFFDYYESNGWKVGRNPMKDWKAAVRTWRQNEANDMKNTVLDYTDEEAF